MALAGENARACRNRKVVMSKLINPVVNVDFPRISLRGKRQLPGAEDCGQGVNEFKSSHTRVTNMGD